MGGLSVGYLPHKGRQTEFTILVEVLADAAAEPLREQRRYLVRHLAEPDDCHEVRHRRPIGATFSIPRRDGDVPVAVDASGQIGKQCSVIHTFHRRPHLPQIGAVWASEHGVPGKGRDMSQWPEDLRVREFPVAAS